MASIDYRTSFEKQLDEFVTVMEMFFDKPVASREQFTNLRGQLRDIKVYLINKQYGCRTGQHAVDCLKLKHAECRTQSQNKRIDISIQ